jgi:chromate transporter
MLPGFVLMFVLSWAYVRYGLRADELTAVFVAVQVAVAALIVRAVFRIGGHVVTDGWLWSIAVGATIAHLIGIHFGILLIAGGLLYFLARRTTKTLARVAYVLGALGLALYVVSSESLSGLAGAANASVSPDVVHRNVSLLTLFWSGLKAGSLTFGGAYTVIPFLQRDAVSQGAWMTNAQFLDGLALSGLLPAPLIIFSTFVGYLGGGPWGAVVMTIGIFLPAFTFTLVGHDAMERFVHLPRVRVFLEGVTAAVVGLIAGTTLALLRLNLVNVEALILFGLILLVLFVSKARLVVPGVIAAALLWGLVKAAMVQG